MHHMKHSPHRGRVPWRRFARETGSNASCPESVQGGEPACSIVYDGRAALAPHFLRWRNAAGPIP
jgi:hypothetical protein